jgi:nitronate monooxygenase
MWKNKLTDLLNIEYPIIQAPMAGGTTTTQLVSAVSNAGGLGMIGAGYMDSESLQIQINEIRKETDKPFGVNLFVPNPYSVDANKLDKVNDILEPFRKELTADSPKTLPNYKDDLNTFNELIDIIIEEKIPICTFTFGLPSKEVISKLKKHSILLMGTATTVQEAMINEKNGMDAIVLQGSEAGGHRGTFIGETQQSLIGLMSLIPQTADQVKVPIIAAGGIMDGRGIMAARCLGASGFQLGTAFLVCEESGAHSEHKDAIIQSGENQIVLTKSFSGKAAKGIQNRFIEKMTNLEDSLPDFPVQNELTKGIRKAASKSGNSDFMSLWAGQSPRLAKKQTVQELMTMLIKEAEKIRVLLLPNIW